MKSFHCAECGIQVFFENNHCLKCNHELGFSPKTLELCTLEKHGEGLWSVKGDKSCTIYRNCANSLQHATCNWLVESTDPNTWCVSCRLNEIIPDLTQPKNLERWKKLELAKRRCIYTFLRLGLPLQNPPGDPRPSLKFKFLEESAGAPVRTGHENGMITINIAEADEDERERRRLNLHEPYRTLVGHFRHESGHFYWDELVADSPELPRYRELFGDETVDYGTALETYYKQGPPADWSNKTVTPYGSSHAWEDWAETWAHYLHIQDSLETAASFGLSMKETEPAKSASVQIKYNVKMDFDQMLAEWTPFTCALNAINRGMGLSDLYPFVIPAPVVEKLRFIHGLMLKSTAKKIAEERKPKQELAAA